MTVSQVLSIFVVTAFISYLFTPFVRMVAVKLDFMDHPLTTKVHAHPKPLLGGVAIFSSFLVGILSNHSLSSVPYIIAVLSGAGLLLTIGLIDDRMGMMPNMKILGQFLAAMIVIKAGVRVEFFGNYYVNVIFTYFWIIGITNAFNLLDNMDGLSGGIAVIAGFFFGVISLLSGQLVVAGLAFSISGACLGFLKHNFPKARIFMGDSGSLVIGFVLSTIAIVGTWRTYVWTTSLMIPILVLGYPIFDTALVIVMRLTERRSIFNGGRDHSSHRLALLGLKKKRAVFVILTICFLLGAAAFFLTRLRPAAGLMIGLASFIAMLSLGIRLGLVKTSREGRKKKWHA
ncbi:glycosyltransferase family 4 protein [Candidatus Omnitrophota bacterium]